MPATSAGLLVYHGTAEDVEVFLVHPGGPYWARKDLGAWSIPKGEIGDDEDPQVAARREFEEETGSAVDGPMIALGEIRQSSGKRVHAWAMHGELDATQIRSNSFEIEWPPRSGRICAFPEVDRAAWFAIDEARRRILPSQSPFLDRLLAALEGA
jgi:predicted NUDIX family NTP pyrophosphohydrolase